MNEFAGRDNELKVLKEAYGEMKKGKPQLVTLIGDTGLGKTRIVQEFYEYLAKNENEGAYWPERLLDKEKSMSLIPDLNKINIKGYDQISWMWYAMRCEERDKRNSISTSTVLDELREQIGIHAYTIYKKKEQTEKNKNAIRSLIGLIASFGLPGAGIPVINAVTQIFSSVDTTLGTKDNLKSIYEKIKKETSNKEANDILQESYKDNAEQAKSVIRSIVNGKKNSGIPCIIVVDDCQWIDEYTLKFINELMQEAILEQFPIMFICTIWENAYKYQQSENIEKAFAGMIENLKNEYSFMGENLGVKEINVLPLEYVDVQNILKNVLRGYSNSVGEVLYKKCSGDLEMLWAYIEHGNIAGENVTGQQEEKFIEWVKKNNSKKDIIAKSIEKLEKSNRELLLCASAEGIVFSKEFLMKCEEIVGSSESEVIYQEFDQKYNFTNILESMNNLAKFKREIYFEVSREMLELSPLNEKVKRVVYDHFKCLIESNQIQLYDYSIKKSIYELLIKLDEEFCEQGDEVIKAYQSLRDLYLKEGMFKECIACVNKLIEMEEYIYTDLYKGIEAAYSAGNIEVETKYIEIIKQEFIEVDPLNVYYYLVSYYSRKNAEVLLDIIPQYKEIIDKQENNIMLLKHYLMCSTAFFYMGKTASAIDWIDESNNRFGEIIQKNNKLYSIYYHTAGLIFHNVDRNQEIIDCAEQVINSYETEGDTYNEMLEKINRADAEMALGQLLKAERDMHEVYEKAKISGYKHAHNIASICYANVLSCLGKTSIALLYYEEGIKLSKEIEHDWDYLYGKIWRCIALAEFHDVNSLKYIEECEQMASQKQYDYLVNLARSFKVICKYELGEEIKEDEVKNVNKENTPGLRLNAVILLLISNNKIESDKYVDEIYELTEKCQGIKGRNKYLGVLYKEKKELFYDRERNIKLEKWISEYVNSYIEDYNKVEEQLFENYNEKPFLYSCDMSKCCGYCCYDGVYLLTGEKETIIKFINQHKKDFRFKAKDYFMKGEWPGLEGCEKTAIQQFEGYGSDYPKHFQKTRCKFSDEKGICELQKNATKYDEHPWKVKPKACWMFPLSICPSDGTIMPPPCGEEIDPDYIDETYPGYVTFLHCGKEREDGTSWREMFKQELLYYLHIKQQEELYGE